MHGLILWETQQHVKKQLQNKNILNTLILMLENDYRTEQNAGK